METLEHRYSKVLSQIKKARIRVGAQSDVLLVAVSKGQPISAINSLLNLGQVDFAENYVQEAIVKINALQGLGIVWHFIGRVQSNKLNEVARHFSWVHSLSNIKHMLKLNQLCAQLNKSMNVCVQVNVSRSALKSGILPEQLLEVAKLIQKKCECLRLRGLMTLCDSADSIVECGKQYRQLFSLKQSLERHNFFLDTLSMGMSRDCEIAIQSGSTLVRVGTSLFGPRRQVR